MTLDITKIGTGTPLEYELGFSQAVRVGNHIFVSGQMSLDESGALLHAGKLDAQFNQALENVKSVLLKSGASLDDVVAEQFFFTSSPNEREFLEICAAHRRAYSGKNQPTGAMVCVPKLPVRGAMVQITAVAVVDCARRPVFGAAGHTS